MARFSLGCAIWSYAGWVGPLFPAHSKPGEFLRLYGQRFTNVEGNTTFYAVPDEATVKKWAQETPPGFRFSPKIPRDLTHNGLLRPSLSGALEFLSRMKHLGERLGTMLLQLPPSYAPNQIEDLRAFLEGWPRQEAPISVEVRNLAWFREPHVARLYALLQGLGVGRAILDPRPIYAKPQDPEVLAKCKKPNVPLALTQTSSFAFVRFVCHPDAARNEPYLQEWAARIREWLTQGISVDFFFHCPMEEQTPLNARRLQAILESMGAPIPPLPWDKLPSRDQLKLF